MMMMMTVFISSFLLVLCSTAVEGQSLPTTPKPGDALDWSVPFPQWWHDIKAQYENREVRKCEFVESVPATDDHCPGVSRRDHYYCIYGTPTEATYFCTCVEKEEFVFHCDSQLRTVDYIRGIENGTINAQDGTPVPPPTLPNGTVIVTTTATAPSPTPAPVEQTTPPGSEPAPGDVIDYEKPVPKWWVDLKNQYKPREVRECDFLEFIPNSGESCPGVSKFGHYYCVYGTPTEPTWFCTCIERNDFTFHCDNQLRTPKSILDPNSTDSSSFASSSGGDSNGNFNSGFWTGFAVMAALVVLYSNLKRWYDQCQARTEKERRSIAAQFDHDDPAEGVTWMRRVDLT